MSDKTTWNKTDRAFRNHLRAQRPYAVTTDVAQFADDYTEMTNYAIGARWYAVSGYFHEESPDIAYEHAVKAFHYASIVLSHLR